MKTRRADFPPGFLFATATSAYQIEGHAHGGAGPTHWDSFAATSGNVAKGHTGAYACDHYHRYAEDLDLVAAAGFDGYRFSTSWARIIPEGRGTPNAAGLEFYDRLVDAMLERGIKPMATLYHWELPAALADRGGWMNPDIAHWFADFADLVTARLGDRLYSTATINEPYCVSWLGHYTGEHAPGLRDIRAATRAMHHILKAHGAAMQAMRANGTQNLGAVFNMEAVTAADQSADTLIASQNYRAHFNDFFLSGVFAGTYPDKVLTPLERHLPQGWQDDLTAISAPVDWCGMNYYTRCNVAFKGGGWPDWTNAPQGLPLTDMGWEIYPQGLAQVLRHAHRYTGDVPIYVTENGMATPGIADPARTDFIDAHFQAALDAIGQGVPLKGFTVWSLLDNFEWALGYDKRFGLVHVDFQTMKRTPKASYHALAKALCPR